VSRSVTTRRDFLRAIGAGAASAAAAAASGRVLGAQEETRNTVSGPMNQNAYLPVKLPPKPNARPVLTDRQRDDLEHQLQCQCGCTLDVYTCRTTDFSCSVSPAMHFDVMGLVGGGYDAREILAAFRKVYGEHVLMAPVREGFNWVGYILPFGALGAGAAVVYALIRRWSHPEAATIATPHVDATPDEIARLNDALRKDQ
jgi:cytochrome c-type biogenesis protein CcmH